MIISTKKGTPKEELEKIVDKFEKQGLDVTLITGKDYNVFGLVGDTTKIDERDVLANPWIASFAVSFIAFSPFAFISFLLYLLS